MKYLVAVAVVGVLLVPGVARADSPAIAPRVSLVRVLTDTAQALVKDKIQGKYVVVRVNDSLQGFKVTSIQHDQLVLSRDKQNYIIPLMSAVGGKADAKVPAKAKAKAPPIPPPPPTLTTVKLPTPKSELLNPYPAKKKLTTVIAPPGLRFDPIEEARKAAAEKAAKKPAPVRKNKRIASLPPALVEPTLLVPKTSTEQTQTIHRDEFDKAVADFTALAKEVQFRRDGKSILVVGIARGSYFHRLGLRKGDRIRSVDGKAIASMDDAAALYARLMAANRFTVVLQRNKSLIKLRYSFDK